MNTVHSCNIHCRTIDLDQAESMNIDDEGKWMPFTFLLDVVIGCKLASDDPDSLTYNATTIFTERGDNYIIDTPFSIFSRIFKEFYEGSVSDPQSSDNDFSLD